MVCFLIIWLITSPIGVEGIRNVSGNGGEENNPEKELAYIKNIENFNTATLTEDYRYCDLITNNSMKIDCKKTVPSSPPPNVPEEPSPYSADDIENFNTATITEDISYCEKINSEELKQECISSLGGTQ